MLLNLKVIIVFFKKNTMTLGTVFNLEIDDYIPQGIIQVNQYLVFHIREIRDTSLNR